MAVNLASFKNSRSYPRPAATAGQTEQVTVAPNTNPGPTKILDFDPNRVESQIYNRHATDGFKFLYQNDPADPVPTIGQIQANGFTVKANDSYSLDVPVAVWAVSDTGNAVPIEIDNGTG